MTDRTYPRAEPFRSAREVDEYLSGDRIVCLICGKRFLSVSHHLSKAHGMAVEDYQDRYRIPRKRGLVCDATRARFSASVRRTMAAGGLAEQHAWIASVAKDASVKGRAERARIERETGRHFGVPPAITAADLRWIIEDVSRGMTLTAAIARSGWSWTGVHLALDRNADLKAALADARLRVRTERKRARSRRKSAKYRARQKLERTTT